MSMVLKFPPKGLSKEERIAELRKSMEAWIDSCALDELVRLFGGEKNAGYSLDEYVSYLNDFAEVWNYRARAKGCENERWNVYDDSFVTDHREVIMTCAQELGLICKTLPTVVPDYILPLGGARYANRNRPQYAFEIYEYVKGIQPDKEIKVVALAGTRMISDRERPAVDTYAPNAMTEFDAMNKGLETSFGLSDSGYEEEKEANANINLSSMVRHYHHHFGTTTIESIAAPSSDPARRANSRDTFEFFLKHYHISESDNVLLVTSQIYVPYQFLKFADLAIEGGYYVECVGYGMEELGALAKPSSYLQEIKGTINAIYTLINLYP